MSYFVTFWKGEKAKATLNSPCYRHSYVWLRRRSSLTLARRWNHLDEYEPDRESGCGLRSRGGELENRIRSSPEGSAISWGRGNSRIRGRLGSSLGRGVRSGRNLSWN